MTTVLDFCSLFHGPQQVELYDVSRVGWMVGPCVGVVWRGDVSEVHSTDLCALPVLSVSSVGTNIDPRDHDVLSLSVCTSGKAI